MAGVEVPNPGELLNEFGVLMTAERTQQAPLLLVTTVDIGGGKSDRIEVRFGDIPMDVATAFVTKHSLPPAIIPRLAVHLEENLAKVQSQKQAAGAHTAKQQGGKATEDAEELAVFHRLYEQAIALRHKLDEKRTNLQKTELESIKQNKTTMSWISSEMMRDRSSGPFGNYGEMLYAESLEALARKKERADRRKQERAQEETAGATFHPEISKLAQNLWTPHECASVPAWQRLSKGKLTKAQERLEMLRQEKEEAEMRECTFKPQLSNRSEKLMTERSQTLRSLNVSAYQQLYQDAVRRQQKQQDYQHWYPEEVTFQPKLHESAFSRDFLKRSLQKEASSQQQGAAAGEDRHMALVNRLYASYEKLQNKLQDARSSLSTAVDPATGKRMFHPETGRAPNFARRADKEDVGEYLYRLKQQQEEKVRAAAEALERKRQDAAASTKASKGSKALLKQLQQKRFRQIFDFLDQAGLGSFNLVALVHDMPEWMDDLDDEVRSDLEVAAKLLSKRMLKHNDSNKSDKSEVSSASFFMPPPPMLNLAGAGGEAVASGDGGSTSSGNPGSGTSYPGSPSQPGVVTFQQFCALMEEVLGSRRGPRTYLAPSPPRKYVPSETYHPQIDEKSKKLAAKKRPKDTPTFELLYEEAGAMNQKLQEKRAEAEAAKASTCTFAPRLVSQQLVKEGRVMKGVRAGTWYKVPASDTDSQVGNIIDDPDSLQALAASVMGEPLSPASGTTRSRSGTAAAATRAAGVAGEASQGTAALLQKQKGSYASSEGEASEQEVEAEEEEEDDDEAAEHLAREMLQQEGVGTGLTLKQQQQLEIEQLDMQLQIALEEQRKLDAELLEHQHLQLLAEAQEAQKQAELGQQQQQQQQLVDEQSTVAAVAVAQAEEPVGAGEEADEGFDEGSAEHKQYLELEREVQQMLEATAAAAAAAEKMDGTTDHEYLSEILGLAQEQVDAMAPAISKLQGLQLQYSRAASAVFSAQATPSTSAFGAAAQSPAAAGQEHITPNSGFKVNTAAAAFASGNGSSISSQGQQVAGLMESAAASSEHHNQEGEESEEELPLESHSTYVPASPAEQSVAATVAAAAAAALAVDQPEEVAAVNHAENERIVTSSSSSSRQQLMPPAGDDVLEGQDLFELAAGVPEP